MSYLNRMLIEEESQFECDGVYETDSKTGIRRTLDIISKQQSDSNTSHIIIAAEPILMRKFFDSWWGKPAISVSHIDGSPYHGDPALRNFNGMITFLQTERLKCVQKEDVKRFYREGGQIKRNIKKKSKKRFAKYYRGLSGKVLYDHVTIALEAHKSTGDDTEDFFQRIAQNLIVPNYLDKNPAFVGELDDFFFGLWTTRPHWNNKQYVHTFHFSMLSEEEEKYLNASKANKDGHFKFRTRLHKSEMNFSFSVCLRKTFVLQGKILYGITEPDPWQMWIMEKLQEDQPKKKIYYDYIPDSDSSDYLSDSD